MKKQNKILWIVLVVVLIAGLTVYFTGGSELFQGRMFKMQQRYTEPTVELKQSQEKAPADIQAKVQIKTDAIRNMQYNDTDTAYLKVKENISFMASARATEPYTGESSWDYDPTHLFCGVSTTLPSTLRCEVLKKDISKVVHEQIFEFSDQTRRVIHSNVIYVDSSKEAPAEAPIAPARLAPARPSEEESVREAPIAPARPSEEERTEIRTPAETSDTTGPTRSFAERCQTYEYDGTDNWFYVQLQYATGSVSDLCIADDWSVEIISANNVFSEIIKEPHNLKIKRNEGGIINVRAISGEEMTDDNYIMLEAIDLMTSEDEMRTE